MSSVADNELFEILKTFADKGKRKRYENEKNGKYWKAYLIDIDEDPICTICGYVSSEDVNYICRITSGNGTEDADKLKELYDWCKKEKKKMFFLANLNYDDVDSRMLEEKKPRISNRDKIPDQIVENYLVSVEFMEPPKFQLTISLYKKIKNIEDKLLAGVDIYRYRDAKESEYQLVFIKKNPQILKNYLIASDSRTYKDSAIIDWKKQVQETRPNKNSGNKCGWPHNFLIAGAPGTGKSYCLQEKIENTMGNFLVGEVKKIYDKIGSSGNETDDMKKEAKHKALQLLAEPYINRVTFYEDYSYENFVGCYKPVPEQGDTMIYHPDISTEWGKMVADKITYKYEAGPFIHTYVKAKNNPKKIYFLVIEEINRARAASVFGDMFQLLDRTNGISNYSITPDSALNVYLDSELEDYNETMKLPDNMYIWATMNNADQGVFPLDSAFKRRWGYMYKDVLSSGREKSVMIQVSKQEAISWESFRESINEKILEFSDEDRCIGPWYFKDQELEDIKKYFISTQEERMDMVNPMVDKLIAYLRNDVFRMNPEELFKPEYLTMPKIRVFLQTDDQKGIRDVFKVEFDTTPSSTPETEKPSDK